MKTIKLYFSFALVSAVCFLACDKVENPNEKYVPGSPITPVTCTGVLVTKTNTLVSNHKKVLVEDYTGMKCGNCPPAAVVADNLIIQHYDSVIVLAIHAGGFSVPSFAPFTANYQTQAGTAWDANTGFGISGGAGNPNGMVNRKDYPGTHIKPYSNWGSIVNAFLAPGNNALDVKLDVTTQYDLSQRLLNVTVKSTFKKAYSGDIKLNVVLSEDSIIGTQKDYSAIPVDVYPYVYDNMLRGSLNGDWGDVIKNAPLVNDTITKKYLCNTLNAAFNDKHISVVVFAYDANNKEVIQTEKVKIR